MATKRQSSFLSYLFIALLGLSGLGTGGYTFYYFFIQDIGVRMQETGRKVTRADLIDLILRDVIQRNKVNNADVQESPRPNP